MPVSGSGESIPTQPRSVPHGVTTSTAGARGFRWEPPGKGLDAGLDEVPAHTKRGPGEERSAGDSDHPASLDHEPAIPPPSSLSFALTLPWRRSAALPLSAARSAGRLAAYLGIPKNRARSRRAAWKKAHRVEFPCRVARKACWAA